MPNWCEGTLKVRGSLENVRRFMEEGIDYGSNRQVDVQVYPDVYKEIEFNAPPPYNGEYQIKGTYRHFIEDVRYLSFCEGHTLFLRFKAAFNASASDLKDVCQTYGIDMKIQTFDQGNNLSQIVEIIGGEIIKDEYVDYDDYDWDCPCPTLGG